MGFFFIRKPRTKAKVPLLFVSDARREFLITDITRNSVASGMYYLLMVVAAFIASIGLMANSPAVVIGAMLVSPLMMPIFGVSLGLVRGEFPLIRDSVFSVTAGILLGVGGAFLIGCFPIFFEITNEIITRTKPNLLDLGVAAFAGIAGTVALIDEKVSPVMPGIAIATALMPPLCTSGLCLALHQYTNAWGAFLLFFANFLVILSVASALFIMTGFIPHSENEPLPRLIKHFSITTIGLILVAGLLTKSLIEVSTSRKINKNLRTITMQAISSTPNTAIKDVQHEITDGIISGFIILQGPKSLDAKVVNKIEKESSQTLNMPVQIIVRTNITQSISSSTKINSSALVNAEEKKKGIKADSKVIILEHTELLLRSLMSDYPWYTLSSINHMNLKNGHAVIAEISGPEKPLPEDVEKIERMLRDRTKQKNLTLIVRFFKSNDITRNGRNLFGTVYSEKESPKAKKVKDSAMQLLKNIRNIFPIYVDTQKTADGWKVLADITGERLITSKEINSIEKKLTKEIGAPVKLYVYSRTEAIISREGLKPLEFFSTTGSRKRFKVD
ncbi:uncharacterized hydrophobic domain-containing protein [Maridesulfovibrio ferrireducens]|uniref:Uncharacterized hydrophobic domain-containing protein n=1 Tax=Maridesulfovibrio ferrireducens TaxID=246191 RepID=A0A1G9B8I3_9BACT|nr:DUF389 domain-containing protein [Maridesulfovibrio ferrireducens]SDK35817.1 uncharacterized hydrophobic domain-containing protein [Maridesulfovibrio ferrireducens]